MRKTSRRARAKPGRSKSLKPRRRPLDEGEDEEDEIDIGAAGTKDESGESK